MKTFKSHMNQWNFHSLALKIISDYQNEHRRNGWSLSNENNKNIWGRQTFEARYCKFRWIFSNFSFINHKVFLMEVVLYISLLGLLGMD